MLKVLATGQSMPVTDEQEEVDEADIPKNVHFSPLAHKWQTGE